MYSQAQLLSGRTPSQFCSVLLHTTLHKPDSKPSFRRSLSSLRNSFPLGFFGTASMNSVPASHLYCILWSGTYYTAHTQFSLRTAGTERGG